ncbi:MAG: hypothetical protein KF729_30960 [Sandaracinaceae bacterium]|nr:hypothetical protein [Sandaracinaceae bacterium]
MEVWRWLEAQGAHHDVVRWARPFGEDWPRAWDECPRGDWLLGVAARAGADGRAITRAACACARFALPYLPDAEERPRVALDALERYVEGGEPPADHAALDAALEAAVDGAPDPAVAAAAMAALAALRSVAHPEDAPLAASSAVQAALLDAGDCALVAAMRHAQASCADLVRTHLARPPLVTARA